MADHVPNTIGLEIEGGMSTIDHIRDVLPFRVSDGAIIKAVTHDASVESIMSGLTAKTSIYLGSATLRRYMRPKNNFTAGYEIVTNPLTIDSMRDVVRKLTCTLIKSGEIFSPRSSIHVHVGFPSGLVFLRNATLMGIAVEPLLYKIAGMGNEYRGAINNSAYARALALPPVTRLLDSNKYAILSPQRAAESKSSNNFWNNFGIDRSERERYLPLRYIAVNLYSVLLRGTLEFRFFNLTLMSRHIEAAARLCQFLSELIIRSSISDSLSLTGLSIFSKNSNGEYLDLLDELIKMGEFYKCIHLLDNDDLETIKELILITPQPIFVNKKILSHVKNSKLSEQGALAIGLEVIKDAEDPGILDIHNFNSVDRSLI